MTPRVLPSLSGDGVGVEAGERADRDGSRVERLGVGLDLLERHDLADLDVAQARRVPRQRRTTGMGIGAQAGLGDGGDGVLERFGIGHFDLSGWLLVGLARRGRRRDEI